MTNRETLLASARRLDRAVDRFGYSEKHSGDIGDLLEQLASAVADTLRAHANEQGEDRG